MLWSLSPKFGGEMKKEKNEKPWLKLKEGEADPGEGKRLVKEALDRRLSARFQYYWFSLSQAKARWTQEGGGICAGNVGDRDPEGIRERKFYTQITFHAEPLTAYPDFVLVGKTRIKADFEMATGITEKEYSKGEMRALATVGKAIFSKTSQHGGMDVFPDIPRDDED